MYSPSSLTPSPPPPASLSVSEQRVRDDGSRESGDGIRDGGENMGPDMMHRRERK